MTRKPAPLTVHGWEEWDLDDDLPVTASRGGFEAEDDARQARSAG